MSNLRIGLVVEGPTDAIVLKAGLAAFLNDPLKQDIWPLNPILHATGKMFAIFALKRRNFNLQLKMPSL